MSARTRSRSLSMIWVARVVEALQEDVLNDVRNFSNSIDMSIERIHDSPRKVRRYW